jgi:hypothetical protein
MSVSPGWSFAAAADELGFTRPRINQLVNEGKLAVIEHNGRRYISDYSLRLFRDDLRRRKEAKDCVPV